MGADVATLFRNEAAHRPAGTVRAEDALTAFRKAGLPLGTPRQHLGRPFAASYCVGDEVGPEIAISLCEYASPEAATAGRAASLKALSSIPNREIVVRQATTLTLRQTHRTPESEKLVRKLIATFTTLGE